MKSFVKNSIPYEISEIKILPFINHPASEPSSVYTALIFASEEAKKFKQKHVFVTFDQALYVKAIEILASNPDLSNVIARLGGFHLLMSYLGTIGYIMGGSGLQELWETIYADKSVEHMMTGHAYSRAVRANFLTYGAVAGLLLKNVIDEELLKEIQLINTEFFSEKISLEEIIDNESLQKVMNIIENKYSETENLNNTAKLWIQYLKQVEILQDFLRSERTGNWDLHISSMKNMLPYFHAAGHLHYAKCTRFYIQQLEELAEKMDQTEFENFTKNGFFTIRRTEDCGSGVGGDLAIEQGLMRLMKVSGGMVGRGITENTLAEWIHSLPYCADICNNIEEFCGVRTVSSEQHVDLRESRQKRDAHDLTVMSEWLELHNPFAPRSSDELIGLVTGNITAMKKV